MINPQCMECVNLQRTKNYVAPRGEDLESFKQKVKISNAIRRAPKDTIIEDGAFTPMEAIYDVECIANLKVNHIGECRCFRTGKKPRTKIYYVSYAK